MNSSDSLSQSRFLRKSKWLLVIPIIKDLLFLMIHYMNYGELIDYTKIPDFNIKMAIPSIIPSLGNILDAFPQYFRYNTTTGWQRSILFQPWIPKQWSTLYIIAFFLFLIITTSFLEGAFLGSVAFSCKKNNPISLMDFIHFGIHYWDRFLVLQVFTYIGIGILLIFPPIFIVYLILSLLFVYIPYAIVWEDCDVVEGISIGVKRFTQKFWSNLGFLLFIGIQTALISCIVIPISKVAVIGSVLIYDVFGTFLVTSILLQYTKLTAEENHS